MNINLVRLRLQSKQSRRSPEELKEEVKVCVMALDKQLKDTSDQDIRTAMNILRGIAGMAKR